MDILCEIEVLRHRLIHGHRGANPVLIEQASQFLDSILTHQERVFGKLLIPLQVSTDTSARITGTSVKLGNVLAQRPGAGRGIVIKGDRQSLITHLKLGNRTPASLPESTILKRLANVVATLS